MKYSTLIAEPVHNAPMLRGVAHRSLSGMKSMPCCSIWNGWSSADPSRESSVDATGWSPLVVGAPAPTREDLLMYADSLPDARPRRRECSLRKVPEDLGRS